MTDFPPEPWDLTGVGHVTLWRVPVGTLPVLPLSARPLTVRDQALVATAFVTYDDRGLMAYDELLAGVLVRFGRRVGLSITDIWVDSETSMRGGRELWGIPKELATFGSLRASTVAGPIASASFTPRGVPGLPVPRVLRGSTVQTRAGRTLASPIRTGGRIRPSRGTWDLDADGPLAWLRAGRPVTSVVAEDFAMRFGS
ncbi:acetoacetate decarboxylase family protein [Nocardioides sp. W7]|uniref:acetoacetate decarboxylase family protein n=1 Tax=Nocardioides sp. W7 TaxID=2931390 RepID=UPI001FD4A3D7|nr:acetoacetate decarboxylase family protein [Nocardioides sp. W7]